MRKEGTLNDGFGVGEIEDAANVRRLSDVFITDLFSFDDFLQDDDIRENATESSISVNLQIHPEL